MANVKAQHQLVDEYEKKGNEILAQMAEIVEKIYKHADQQAADEVSEKIKQLSEK